MRNTEPRWSMLEPKQADHSPLTDIRKAARREAGSLHARPCEDELPIFDRGRFAPLDPAVSVGLQSKGAPGPEYRPRYRTADDRRLARRIVTGQTFGDPKPCRAGKAPDCEESLRRERSDEAYRLLGKEPPANGYAYLDLDTTVEQLDRLRPRRYRPGSSEQ